MTGPSHPGKDREPVDWARLRPRRACGWEERDGRISLLAPRFGRGRLGRALDGWFRLRPVRIRLDALGTFVWERIDGIRTVRDIAGELQAAFGARAEAAGERLPRFLRTLERGRLIDLGAADAAKETA